MVPQTAREWEPVMWFCEMRRMPRLRDCLCELASDLLRWLGDRPARARGGPPAAAFSRSDRGEAGRTRPRGWAGD